MSEVAQITQPAATPKLEVPLSIGEKIRNRRRQLGFTLDDLSIRTKISKPYLSLIETGACKNPPLEDKLVILERVLGFTSGDLVFQAEIARIPQHVLERIQSELQRGRVVVIPYKTIVRERDGRLVKPKRKQDKNSPKDIESIRRVLTRILSWCDLQESRQTKIEQESLTEKRPLPAETPEV